MNNTAGYKYFSIILLQRWADKFCLHCNIFIYIRHIWIKPVLCSRMVSLPPHFTLNLQMLTVLTQFTSKWKSFSDVRFKQRAVIEFLTLILLAWKIWWAPNNASKWQMGFNSAFKGLTEGKVPPIESQTNASRLWWSVCWCEYSKTLDKVKSAVRKWFQKQNTNFLKDGFQKLVQHWRKCTEVRRDFVEK